MTSITDIWFRSERELLEVANALGLSAIVQDAEDTWQWVIGELRGVRLDVTRDHTRRRQDVDVRIFRVDNGELGPELTALVIARLRPLADGAIKCGQWIYRSGNDFDRVVVEERG